MKRFEIFFGVIKIPVDFLMVVLAFISAYKLRLITQPIEGFANAIDYTTLPSLEAFLQFSIKATLALIVVFIIGRMYTLKSTVTFSKEIRKVFIFVVIWTMLIITYFFFTRTFPFSRLAMIYSWTFALAFLIFGRALIKIIQRIFLKLGIGKRKILFIGNNRTSSELNLTLGQNPSYSIIGVIGKNSTIYEKIKILGNINQLEYIVKKNKIDEIIQTESSTNNILEFCDLHHIQYSFVPDLIEVRQSNINIETVGTIPVISLKPTPLDGWGRISKRVLDIIGALLGLIILSPIFLLIAMAIKLDSKGPILFTKLDNGSPVKRVGEHGKLFKFYKFRSMYPNTDHLRYTKLAEKNLRKDGPLIKISNDPRVTFVGRFLRKYSLDELPQLWNVLIGNLSLVGPRPHLPEEVAKYQNHHRFVLTIKPGITGLAQISGRSDIPFEEEVKLDRFYIENWSLFLDIKIVFKTIGTVLKGYRE